MKRYETLNHEIFYIDELPKEHIKFYEEVKKYYEKEPNWNEFGNFWIGKINSILGKVKREEAVKTPIFRICQDMESRLGIKQGYTRTTDYRDILAKIIAEKYHSRYRFCREVGIDEAFLSNVLKKKKHFSTEKLQEILERAGYEIEIRKKIAVSV